MKTIVADGKTHEISDEVICIIPSSGIRVDVPNYTEISARTTLKCMEEMSQRGWENIHTGEVFKELFRIMFTEKEVPKIPFLISDVLKMGHDVLHIMGLIILTFEAVYIKGENVFWREPETFLHPRQEQILMTLLYKFMPGKTQCEITTSKKSKSSSPSKNQKEPLQE